MKKVLIISTSPRKNSNSEALAEAFAKGAQEAGHETELISLRGKNISFCRGCFVCQEKLRCVIHDDADLICQKALKADILVFATPIYYYEMSGQLKTLLDRLNPLFPSDYIFNDVYLLTAAAEDEAETPKRAEMGLTGWIDCYPKSRLTGTLFCGGVNDPREIEGNPKLQEAFDLGKSIG